MDIIEIERALITRYRNKIYSKFIKAIEDFKLLKANDVIGVCLSGGKDSFVLAKLFQEFERHGPIPIKTKYLVMDPGFKAENLENLKTNAGKLGIPIILKESNIFKVTKNHGKQNPCFLCARMRRGFLYKFGQENGCNKIALGHHFNDVIETILLNILYGGTFKTMLPKLKAENFEDMELIRPMFYIEEKSIINYLNFSGIVAMNCGCEIAEQKLPSKRREIKELILRLKKDYPNIEKNIFQSANNVNLDYILGWTSKNKKTTFLDR